MHVQRIHYWKLVTVLIFIILLLTFFIHPGVRDSIDIEVEEVLVQNVQTSDPHLAEAIARADTCPACLGRDLCPEIAQQFLTISLFAEKTLYGEVYKGSLNNEDHLSVLSPSEEIWSHLDKRICRDAKQRGECKLSSAAPKTFLHKWSGDPNFLHGLNGILGHNQPSALTACASRSLAQSLIKAFDDNHDGGFSLEEKAELLTTTAVSPATAMLRLGRVLGMSSLPRYIGACGRLSVFQGELTSLREFVDYDLDTRMELASQALSLVSSLVTREDMVMVVWGLDWADLSVTSSGQVILSGLDKVSPVDKSLLEAGEERPVCNKECFDKWRSEVIMATPRGQPGRGCSGALQHGDMMYRDLCSHVLADSDLGPGLLHSAGEEITRALAECVEEPGPGARWRAVDTLMQLLDENSEVTTETSTETSTEKNKKRDEEEEEENTADEEIDENEESNEEEDDENEDNEHDDDDNKV